MICFCCQPGTWGLLSMSFLWTYKINIYGQKLDHMKQFKYFKWSKFCGYYIWNQIYIFPLCAFEIYFLVMISILNYLKGIGKWLSWKNDHVSRFLGNHLPPWHPSHNLLILQNWSKNSSFYTPTAIVSSIPTINTVTVSISTQILVIESNNSS